METMLPGNLMLDCVDRLFFQNSEISKPFKDYLPILGTSALEQILSPSASESSSASSCCSSSSGFGEMERMSPDSTMDPILGGMSPTHGSNMLTPISQQPDSTTHDLSSYDSDAFDSEDSVSSFAEVQEMAKMANSANAANAALLWPKQLPQDVEQQRRVRRSMSSSSSDSYSDNFSNVALPHRNIKAKMNKRKKTKRAEEVLLKCQMCDYTTRFKEHLTSHMHTHDSDRNYMCSDCGQTFKWSHSLKRHQRTHQTHPDFRYTCNFCFKTFSRKDHLTIHEDLHTTSNETFPCAQCGATFKNRKTLTGHMKTHTSQKDFKCDECDSQFTRRASLNRHVRAAHAGQVIACPLCPAVFSYRSTLEDHKKAAHNEGKREFGCSLCGVQFAVKAYLSKHMVTCRNRAVGRSFGCSLCGKSFPTKRHLNEHGKRKHPTIVVAQQQQQIVPPLTTTTTTTTTVDFSTSKCESSFDFAAAPTKCEPSLPSMTSPASMPLSNVPQMPKPSYLSNTDNLPLYHNNLQDPASQMLQCPSTQNYVQSSPSMFQNDVNGCYLFNNSRTDSSKQQQLQINHHNSNHCSADEENVGSLLRLVYSCPDPMLDHDSSSYVDQNQYYNNQHQLQHGGQICSGKSNDNLMEYPMLDGIALEYM